MARVFALLLQEDLNIGIGAATKPNPGGGDLTGTQIGRHSWGIGQQSVTQAWTPGTVAVGGVVTTTVTYPGAALGDYVDRSFDLSTQGLLLLADVTAVNTVTVVLANLTGAPVTIGAGNLKILVSKSK